MEEEWGGLAGGISGLSLAPSQGDKQPAAHARKLCILLHLNSCAPVSATLGAVPLCRTPVFGEVVLKRRSALRSSALQRMAKALSSSWQGDNAAF